MGSRSLIPFQNLKDLELIAAGSHGQVFRGQYGYGQVAIKKYFVADDGDNTTELVAEWKRESGILKSLRHPNIIQFFGICLEASHFYIVTELASFSLYDLIVSPTDVPEDAAAEPMEGTHALHNLLESAMWPPTKHDSGANPEAKDIELTEIRRCTDATKWTDSPLIAEPGGKIVGEVPLLLETWRNAVGFEKNGLLVEIARQILEAVVFMHGRRVIHRDLKPGNLLVVEWEAKWTVKVADFGMARFVLPGEDALTTLVGSPHYVAPELMKGEKDYTEAVDIYSVGMVLWALIHEKDPMHEAGVYTIIDKIVNKHERPEIHEGCSPFFTGLITDCWVDNPQKRPSAADILERLRAEHKVFRKPGNEVLDSARCQTGQLSSN